ncbi:hypothetical protein FGB62_156g02 [Gracilaria domingensis]|nr:hypothetical protein FGB62_156g02 [Gracilaria domingensis]
MNVLIVVLSVASVAFAQWNCPKYDTIVLKDTAVDAEGLSSIVTNFTELIGGEDNGNSAGPLAGGQRSINWDAPIVPFDMARDFFNVNVTRGAVFYTEGGQFAVSNPSSPPPQDDRFSSLLPESISERFRRFSLERLFTPVLSNKLNVKFEIPATTTKAKVSGFGAVFTDVKYWNKTYMSYRDVMRSVDEEEYVRRAGVGCWPSCERWGQ